MLRKRFLLLLYILSNSAIHLSQASYHRGEDDLRSALLPMQSKSHASCTKSIPMLIEKKVLYNLGSSWEQQYIAQPYKDFFSLPLTPERIEELAKQAESNDRFAQCVLGILFEQGIKCVIQDFKKAAMWYMRAAMMDEPEACYRIGKLYKYKLEDQCDFDDFQIGQKSNLSSFWYTKAAEQGHILAQYNIGRLHAGLPAPKNAERLPRNVEKAHFWLNQSAQQGFLSAQELLPTRFLLEIAQQENSQSPPGQLEYLIGTRYAKGFKLGYMPEQDIEKDPAKARHWLEKAAKAGYSGSLFALGEIAEKEEAGVTIEQAIDYYTQAIEREQDCRALKQLGIIYQEGKGCVPEDKARALDCFRKAYSVDDVIEKDFLYRDPDFLYRFGCLLESSASAQAADVKDHPDQKLALIVFERLVDFQRIRQQYGSWEFNSDVEYRLGQMYEEGRGGEQNDARAASHYKKIIAAVAKAAVLRAALPSEMPQIIFTGSIEEASAIAQEAQNRLTNLHAQGRGLTVLERCKSALRRGASWIFGRRGIDGDTSTSERQKRVASDPALDTPVPKRPRTGGSRAGPALPASSVESENTSAEEAV